MVTNPTPAVASSLRSRPEHLGEALERLRTAQKSGAGAAPYSRWVNRRLGRLLAAVAAVAGMSPNQVTLVSASCTFPALALVALVRPRWWLGLIVGALLLLGYALDAADGQLARLLGRGSRSGEWLDHVIDAAKVSVLHSVVLVSFYRFTDASDVQLLVALGYQAVSAVLFFGLILIDQLRRSADPGGPTSTAATKSRRFQLVQTAIAVPADYATLCLCFALLGWQRWFRTAYSTLFVLNALFLLTALARWWRQVRAMDQPAPA